MKKTSAAHRRSRHSPTRTWPHGLLALALLSLICPLSGCHWVFGDYEVVEEPEKSPLEEPCQTEGEYYCEENVLYLCTDVGQNWMPLLVCMAGYVCDASQGNCTQSASASGTSGTSTTGSATGAGMDINDTGIGGTAQQ